MSAGNPSSKVIDDNDSYHSDSTFDEKDDQDWADWGEDEENSAIATHSLFAQPDGQFASFNTPLEALQDAKSQGCDFRALVRRLRLDALQVIRLVNHTRRNRLSPQQLTALQGTEPFLSDDAEMKPVPGFEMDGLLQIDFDIERDAVSGAENISDEAAYRARIEELESQLMASKLAFDDMRERLASEMGIASTLEESRKEAAAGPSRGPIAGLKPTAGGGKRDDDTHYFDSYASNDIHQTMISDRARTLSYGRFLMSPENAHLIRGKTVMDVGCGSGILSLFCARAGAKEVVAIDASNIADRARLNVEENGFGHVIKVVKGKVEELDSQLEKYVGKVDLLVSEWMGYFLLYECMLPSVLYARDRYLNPTTGLLAPSHCRMTLAAISDGELLHERLRFWDDVHGFRMSAMTKGLTEEAYTESLKPEAVVSSVADIYDLPLQIMSYRQPTFVAPFTLECTSDAPVHGFASWFDTWFMTDSKPWPLNEAGQPEKRDTRGGEKLDGLPECDLRAPTEADVPAIGLRHNAVSDIEGTGKGEVVSFTTGPFGLETHWKQTVFLLKEAIEVKKGDILAGEIHVTQSTDNSRELDVEIHYTLSDSAKTEEEGPKARRVNTRLVQLFKVR